MEERDARENSFGERMTHRGGEAELRAAAAAAAAGERERAARERAALEEAAARGELSVGDVPTVSPSGRRRKQVTQSHLAQGVASGTTERSGGDADFDWDETGDKSFGERMTHGGGEAELRAAAAAAAAGERERAARERAALEDAVARGELSVGEALTRDHPAWRTQEEWQGRRWKPGEAILGRYVVEGELGQGGMGVVYACLDKVGGVKVAVKALPPEVGRDRDEMEEIRENFRLVYRLSHPNIAGVRTLEQDGRGECFLVMEKAEGESLRRWMKRKWREGGLSAAEAVPVLRQMASALDYAHSERVIHRDVKPGNAMMDERGRVKMLDFGLAAQIRSSMSRVSRETGRTSGTRTYMAPEQWEGQAQDARTDQYALGVVAYEMLAGRLPFDGDDAEVLRGAVLNGTVRDIEGVDEAAMAALRRALAKKPRERFGSCGEFVDALEGKQPARPMEMAAGGWKGSRMVPAGEDVFLRKVRLAKALDAAGKENATPEERSQLVEIKERFAAGEEALKAGDRGAAAGLFAQAEERLAEWKKNRDERTERERREAEIRRQREETERKAQERARRIAEEKRLAEEEKWRAEEEKRRQEKFKALAAVEAAKRKRFKVLQASLVIVVAVLLVKAWMFGLSIATQGARRADKMVRVLGMGEEAGETKAIMLPGGAEMEMVWCPPGEFTMGSPRTEEGRGNNETQHRVTLTKGFWMAKTEVTQRQWKSVMGNNPSRFKGDDLPVENVIWKDCQEFCRKAGLGLRLPTEAEWEYACRAGSTGPYAGTGKLEDMGWYADNSGSETHPVGRKSPNAWGLCDMHGNVWEWCADWYQKDFGIATVTDPTGPASGSFRVLRGGCWHSFARYCRSADRNDDDPASRDGRNGGFRPCSSAALH